jgi:hypothetical protein
MLVPPPPGLVLLFHLPTLHGFADARLQPPPQNAKTARVWGPRSPPQNAKTARVWGPRGGLNNSAPPALGSAGWAKATAEGRSTPANAKSAFAGDPGAVPHEYRE